MYKRATKIKSVTNMCLIAFAIIISTIFFSGMVFGGIQINGKSINNNYNRTYTPAKEPKGTVYSVSSSVYGNGWMKAVFKCNGKYYYIKYNNNSTDSVRINENARIGCKEDNMEKYGFKKTDNPNH